MMLHDPNDSIEKLAQPNENIGEFLVKCGKRNKGIFGSLNCT